MAYYGLSLNSGNMPGSLYVNLTLSAIAELIGYLLIFFCHFTGRRLMYVVSMVVGGLGCVCSIPILYIETGRYRAFSSYVLFSKQQSNWCFIPSNEEHLLLLCIFWFWFLTNEWKKIRKLSAKNLSNRRFRITLLETNGLNPVQSINKLFATLIVLSCKTRIIFTINIQLFAF